MISFANVYIVEIKINENIETFLPMIIYLFDLQYSCHNLKLYRYTYVKNYTYKYINTLKQCIYA